MAPVTTGSSSPRSKNLVQYVRLFFYLGGLLEISNLRTAFNHKVLKLKNGEPGTIGHVNGLLVITHLWVNAKAAVIWVCSYYKQYEQIAGNTFDDMSFKVSWEGEGKDTQMKITSTYSGTSGATDFSIAYQNII